MISVREYDGMTTTRSSTSGMPFSLVTVIAIGARRAHRCLRPAGSHSVAPRGHSYRFNRSRVTAGRGVHHGLGPHPVGPLTHHTEQTCVELPCGVRRSVGRIPRYQLRVRQRALRREWQRDSGLTRGRTPLRCSVRGWRSPAGTTTNVARTPVPASTSSLFASKYIHGGTGQAVQVGHGVQQAPRPVRP